MPSSSSEVFDHETTLNSETSEVKGSDGNWYKVPQPVFIKFMTLTGFAGVNAEQMLKGIRERDQAKVDIELSAGQRFRAVVVDDGEEPELLGPCESEAEARQLLRDEMEGAKPPYTSGWVERQDVGPWRMLANQGGAR